MNREPTTEFESRMSRGESLAALLYLPVHILALPQLLAWIMLRGWVGEAGANLLCYALGFIYMLAFEGRFLRREFDPLCDRPGRCLLEICVSYGLMLGLNLCVNGLLTLLLPAENPNNAAIMDMAGMEMGKISAMAVFLAPVVEELMFRGGVFGVLRRKNRVLAYAASMLLFSVYHVWGYAMAEPLYWLFIIQYLPISWLLCRCYERTGTIWTSIFLHMLVNGISLKPLSMLQELM